MKGYEYRYPVARRIWSTPLRIFDNNYDDDIWWQGECWTHRAIYKLDLRIFEVWGRRYELLDLPNYRNVVGDAAEEVDLRITRNRT